MSTTAAAHAQKKQGLEGVLKKLSEIQIGGSGSRVRKKDLIYIFRNLTTLLENGLSLARALATLREEKSLKRYQGLFATMERHVLQGAPLSGALAEYPATFNELMVNQIRVGERAGRLSETIGMITSQLENGANIRGTIIKKMTYPILLATAGSGALTFMLLFVVPTFEKMYSDSGARLPAITQFLIDVGNFLTTYGWAILIVMASLLVTFTAVWRNPQGRIELERRLLRVPMVESWLRSIALLQFIEVLGNLMDSGFTLADALPHTSRGISNRWIRQGVSELHAAVQRGERFSRELERRSDIFPPVVTQLVIVGEQTGTLARATKTIREHLRKDVERYTNLLIGSIEPVMTIGLAASIGGILLAIYIPMFDMIGAMNH